VVTRALQALSRLDTALLGAPKPLQAALYALTIAVLLATALSNVPRSYLDLSGLPGVSQRHDTYGTDTIADMYVARVVRNDPFDMYTKAKVEQTPLEAATWSREASSPYPPAVLLAQAGLSALGDGIGIGFYGATAAL